MAIENNALNYIQGTVNPITINTDLDFPIKTNTVTFAGDVVFTGKVTFDKPVTFKKDVTFKTKLLKDDSNKQKFVSNDKYINKNKKKISTQIEIEI